MVIGEALHRRAHSARKGTCEKIRCRFFNEQTMVVDLRQSSWMMIPTDNRIYALPQDHHSLTLCKDCLMDEVMNIFSQDFDDSVLEWEEKEGERGDLNEEQQVGS